jgi:hypothetical protein
MAYSWYSINITSQSNEAIFSGYFSVNNATNVTQEFYNAIDLTTNILVAPSLTYNNDNIFINNNFTSNGIIVSSIPSLSTDICFLFYDTYKGNQNIINYGVLGVNGVFLYSSVFKFTFQSTTNPLNPIIPICFPAGTPVQTDQGTIAIEKINPSTNTIRGNKIVAITKTVTIEDKIVCIEKDALGSNIPSQKTYISRNHKLFYNKQMIKAKHLVGKVEGVYNKKYNGEVLYNVLLETHEKMMVNNLIVETLNPENIVAKLYNDSLTETERNNAIVNINQCANDYKKVYGKLR